MILLLALTTSLSWGGTGGTIAAVNLHGHVADVHLRNELTSGPYHNEGQLSANGVTVTLRVEHQPGDMPDRFFVDVPDGYIAVPQWLDLDEETSGVIRIFELEGMVTG